MENKNIASDGIDWIVYDSFKKHCEKVKELQEKPKAEGLSQKAEGLSPEENEELTYHKDRIDCIKQFAENKKVPVVYVPDKCFYDNCKAPNNYGDAENALFDAENSRSELLYPKGCTEQNNKDALVLDYLPKYDIYTVTKKNFKYRKKIDQANPYLPDGQFSVRQKSDVNDCWLLSIIIGIIDHDAKYIPKKMVRDYPDNNQDKGDDEIDNNKGDEDDEDVNEDIEQRPNKAVVRLHDEDGLPVDIVVDKTRPVGDKRPLWIIMLEKAVCVMMGIDKFKNCYGKPELNMYQHMKGQRTVLGINWNNIGSKNEDGSRTLNSEDIVGKFNIADIDHGQESVGIKIILGKNNKRLDSNNKNNTVENIQQNLASEKLVLIGTGDVAGDLKYVDHTLYLKSINNDKMTTIDSLSGKLETSAKNNIKPDTTVHITDFPDIEKSIENEINSDRINTINTIEAGILGKDKNILKEDDKKNNKKEEVNNSTKIDLNEDKNKLDNNKKINYNKAQIGENHTSAQSSSPQKPSNKFKNIGIAAIILGLLGFVITLIIKLLFIETLSLLVIILLPLLPIAVGIILIVIHINFIRRCPAKLKGTASNEKSGFDEQIDETIKQRRDNNEHNKFNSQSRTLGDKTFKN